MVEEMLMVTVALPAALLLQLLHRPLQVLHRPLQLLHRSLQPARQIKVETKVGTKVEIKEVNKNNRTRISDDVAPGSPIKSRISRETASKAGHT